MAVERGKQKWTDNTSGAACKHQRLWPDYTDYAVWAWHTEGRCYSTPFSLCFLRCTHYFLNSVQFCAILSRVQFFPVCKSLHSAGKSHQYSPFLCTALRSLHGWSFLQIIFLGEERHQNCHVANTECIVLHDLSIYLDCKTSCVAYLSSDLWRERSECVKGQWPTPDGKLYKTGKENSLAGGEFLFCCCFFKESLWSSLLTHSYYLV